MSNLIVLGIETSCDETSVAIVDSNRNILSHIILSQLDIHKEFGGVVPEIAARGHMEILPSLVQKSLGESNLKIQDLSAIAATGGPGLIGGVIVGTMVAKGMAFAANKPYIAVNHLEGHALSPRLSEPRLEFPYLLLLVSGGHCQILEVNGVGDYKLLGSTTDDAVGEAFDKTAKAMGLDYPGGPKIEAYALKGDSKRFKFPTPLLNQDNLNFSFSGLKTAVKRTIDSLGVLSEQDISDVSACLQHTIGLILLNKMGKALKGFAAKQVVIAGGVAANQYLRKLLADLCQEHGKELFYPPLTLCTDNGAMIAWAGLEHLRLGQISNLNFVPRPRWPLSN
ncbi:MAG: tRNA (adenosine(37)-N6)-threonylcarbamoyltransferase complex transferase subunit TsaD [Rickettsiales bacterium]